MAWGVLGLGFDLGVQGSRFRVQGVRCKLWSYNASNCDAPMCYLTESVHTVVLQKLIPAKYVNLFSTLVMIKDKLTDLCGNRRLLNDFINTSCEIDLRRPTVKGRIFSRKAAQNVCGTIS